MLLFLCRRSLFGLLGPPQLRAKGRVPLFEGLDDHGGGGGGRGRELRESPLDLGAQRGVLGSEPLGGRGRGRGRGRGVGVRRRCRFRLRWTHLRSLLLLLRRGESGL